MKKTALIRYNQKPQNYWGDYRFADLYIAEHLFLTLM